MKQVSQELNNYLNTEKHFVVFDMYVLQLKDGRTFYIADADKDIEWDGKVWNHNMFLISRDQIKVQGTPTVDTLSVNIKCDINDKLGDVPFMLACHNGLLENSMMALYKAYFKDDKFVGAFKIFEGVVEVSNAGGLGVKLSVKSVVQGLAQEVPIRIFAPQSAYTNKNGVVTSSSSDTCSMLIPLKPSMKVLVKI